MPDLFLERIWELLSVQINQAGKDKMAKEIERERALRLLQIIHDLVLLMYPYPAGQKSVGVPMAAFYLGEIGGIASKAIKEIREAPE